VTALDALHRDPLGFDAAFSDVVMPGMSGIELGEVIRTRFPRLSVILTSGYSPALATGGSHGFELIDKPYSIESVTRGLCCSGEGDLQQFSWQRQSVVSPRIWRSDEAV